MKRFIGVTVITLLVLGSAGRVRADDKGATALIDKAIKALGGEEKLSKVKAVSYKSKGTITIGGNDNEITTSTTIEGLDKHRLEFKGKFGEMEISGVTVLNGDKGSRKFGDQNMELDKDAVANEKRTLYLNVVPMTLVHLKDKSFKVEAAGEDKVGGKPASGIKVTPADGKEFKLYFDNETGLPAKLVAKVIGFDGQEFTQETTYDGYKEVDGIKKAMKTESKKDGDKFISMEITEFKVLEKVDAKLFATE